MSPEAPVASFSMRKQLAFTIVIVVSVLGSIETRWFEALDDDLRGGGAGADLYIPDAELFWRLRPGTAIEVPNSVYQTRTRPVTWNIQINEEGFRGPPQRPRTTRRRGSTTAFPVARPFRAGAC